ncbi:MAG: branched-chain amino acid ABC transporter substrate-binding protein [Candidatus Zixiibacteriota bacterium]
MRLPAIIIIVCLLLIGLIGCGGQSEKVVRIALAGPLTGDDATHGQGMKRAMEIAVEDANAAKVLGDIKIELAVFDDRSDPKEAVTVANQIISDRKIIGVIGHFNSGCSIPASQVYARRDLVMITPASTNPKLTLQGLKNVFRVCGTDDLQGIYGANYLYDTLKVHRVAVIHDKTAYGQGLAEEFQKQFLSRGGTITSFDGIDRGDKDFKALLTRIRADNPEILYFGGLYAEAGLMSKQCKDVGLMVPLFGGDGILTNEFVRIAGPVSEGDYSSMVGLPPEKLPEAKDFLDKYARNFPGLDVEPFDPLTYEAASLLLDAYARVNQDQSKLISQIASGTYHGILGETSFDEHGDNRLKLVSINRVINGRFQFYEHPAAL